MKSTVVLLYILIIRLFQDGPRWTQKFHILKWIDPQALRLGKKKWPRRRRVFSEGFPERWEMEYGCYIYIYIHEWDIQYVNWYRILLINSSWTGERWWWLWCLRQTSEAKPPWVLGKQCLEDQEGHWQRCLWYSTVANHEMYLVGVIVSPFFVGDLIASPRCKESVRLIFAA